LSSNPEDPSDVGKVWQSWFATNAFDVDKRLRRVFRILPSDPRCKFCNSPFHGAGGLIVRVLFRKQASALNPRFCNMCDEAMRKFPGGAEVEMSMLFADIRGSTELSAQMSPAEFGGLINRFYSAAAQSISAEDGLVEKLAGDAVAAFWGAGFAGPDYVRRTVNVAKQMSSRMQQRGIPVGIGVHAGVAFFGAVGTPDGLTNMTAAGEEVNLAARLASQAAAGEIIVSEKALNQAGMPAAQLEARTLELKGISAPVAVRVIHAG
jgi:adenylate cyclase